MSVPDPLPTWAIVELLGHRRLAGYVEAVDVAGAPFLRVNVPEAGTFVAQLVPPASVYAITPTTEATAQAAAENAAFRPDPVMAYEVARREPSGGDVIAWLRDSEFDRLRWAVARARGHDRGSTSEDEADVDAILRELATADIPF